MLAGYTCLLERTVVASLVTLGVLCAAHSVLATPPHDLGDKPTFNFNWVEKKTTIPKAVSRTIFVVPSFGKTDTPMSDKPLSNSNSKMVEVLRKLDVPDPNSVLGPIPGLVKKSHKDWTKERYTEPQPPPLRSGVPRVALLLPLTGPNSKLGQSFLNAAQLALFHFADKEFELLTHDTQGTPEGAADAVALAIGDGASLILGPVFSSSIKAIAPAAEAAGLTVISFSNDQTVARKNIFTMGFLPSEQVKRITKFAFNKGLTRFALLAPDNNYGRLVYDALEQAANDQGFEIARASFYDSFTDDFSPLWPTGTIIRDFADYDLRRQNLLEQRQDLEKRSDAIADKARKRLENLETFGDLPFDALILADGGKRLQAISALLPHYDIDPKKTRMLGTALWGSDDIITEPALLGGWFAAPPDRERKDFVKNYIEIFGAAPIRLATLAYDATAIAAVFINPDGSFYPTDITTTQGFAGRDGIFRFTPEGYSQRGLSIYQVSKNGNKVIENPPDSFRD